MPASTPVYGITYPCSGDTIDPTIFATHAISIQAALAQVSALETQLLEPPAALVRQNLGTQSIAAGVTTVATYDFVVYDTAAMFNSGTPTLLTITQPGTYVANFQLRMFSAPTTLTSFRAALRLNGAEVSYVKSDDSTVAFGVDTPMWTSALLPFLVAGDTISTTALFTGTGNMPIATLLSLTRLSTI